MKDTQLNSSKNEKITDEEKLKYLQTKIHETTLECINSYLLLKDKVPLIDATLSLSFMDFRNSVARSIGLPSRSKGSQSAIANLIKEVSKKLENISSDSSLEEIDKMVEKVVKDVSKDFFGATLVLHSQNDLKDYCEESDDLNVKRLYDQISVIDTYLYPNVQMEPVSGMKKFFANLRNLFSKNITIDISGAFIDKDINLHAPKRIPPLNTKVSTPKQYYEQLVGLLTLLTNCSMPYIDKDGKTNRLVSQTDISYFKLIEQAKTYKPKNNNEWIKILTNLANKAYFTPYEPFDIQLDKALNEMQEAKRSKEYNQPFSDDTKKVECINNLEHYKDNLEALKKDRLLNYILKKEMPRILNRLSNLSNLDVDILSTKEQYKDNGFYANYYILKINNIAELELQAQSEFRSYLSKEGNASHNSTLNGKYFDIRHLFELNEDNMHPFKEDETLDFYCNFLDTVNINDTLEYKVSKEDMENLEILQKLVAYASSKIKVKDSIIENNRDTSFLKYIDSVLEYFGAEFTAIYAAHRIEHNQSITVPQNKMYSLETLLKNRVGLSALANLIRVKYKEETSKIGEELLPRDVSRAYSSSLAPKTDLSRINNNIKEKKEHFNPLNTKFEPQGNYSNNSNNER